MMIRGTYAHLVTESPFHGVFPHGKAPICSVLHSQVELEGDPETEVYFLDWNACTAEQRYRVAELVAQQCQGTRQDVVAAMESGIPLPIRLSQVSCVTCYEPGLLIP